MDERSRVMPPHRSTDADSGDFSAMTEERNNVAPIDILEIAQERLRMARVALHNRMTTNAWPDPIGAGADLELARIDLFFAQQDMANVAQVMEGLRG